MEENQTLKSQLPLTSCRRFDGPADEFWGTFGDALLQNAAGKRALFIRLEIEADDPSTGVWKPFYRCPSDETGPFPLPLKIVSEEFDELASSALADGVATHLPAGARAGFVLLHLLTRPEHPQMLALVVVDDTGDLVLAGDNLLPAQDVLLAYEDHRTARETRDEGQAVTRVLDILAATNDADRFTEAAMAVCNEAAAQFQCERVSLGWSDGRYIRLRAISGMDRFDSKMDAVQSIEACLEEAADQNCEVLYPDPSAAQTISRAHAALAVETTASAHLLSIPLTKAGSSEGGLLLERDQAFSTGEIRSLHVLAEQSSPRMATLFEQDRWLGARIAGSVRKRAARFLGPEATWAKIAAIVGALLLAFLLFFPWNYKVEAEFMLRSEDLQHLPAPYDGYIQTVTAKVGDEVKKGDVLLTLDTGQLRLEEASALASIERYSSEAQKAESEGRLADMLVSNSLRSQSEAALELARYRISQAELRAPFEGVLVAGDFRDKIGSPVKTGDVLMRMTRLEDLYVELKIEERDIDEVSDSSAARVAFASQPAEKFAVSLDGIEPVAVAESEGNVFIARAQFSDDAQVWWRPGMTGVAKVEAGERSLLWVFTHRLNDFLRMKLWF